MAKPSRSRDRRRERQEKQRRRWPSGLAVPLKHAVGCLSLPGQLVARFKVAITGANGSFDLTRQLVNAALSAMKDLQHFRGVHSRAPLEVHTYAAPALGAWGALDEQFFFGGLA